MEKRGTYTWTPSGKIAKIQDDNKLQGIIFGYDPMGNRIYKKIVKGGGGPDKHTIYQRDAQGNTLAVYDNHVKSSEFIACKYDAKDIELVFEDIERAYDNCQPEMKPDCIEKEIERLRDKIADKDPCTKLIYEYIWSQNQPCYLDEQYRSLIEQFYNDHYGDYHSQADAAAKEDFLSSKANDIGDAHKMSKEQLDCFKEKLRRAMDMDQDKFNTYFNNLKNGIEYEQWKADIIDWLVNNGQSYTKHTDEVQAGKLYWQEQHLYGSKRLGMALPKRDITDNSIPPYESWLVGRQYELTNHLGNVLATIKDEKKQYSKTGSKVDYYEPFITSSTDYYPFGMTMPNRSYSANSSYRFGWQSMERDDEVAGSGNHYTTLFRPYDPRLGKWWAVDPEAASFPWQSPFVSMSNNPISRIDPLGNSDDWVEDADGNIKWDENVTSADDADLKDGERYLGKAVVVFEGSESEKLGKGDNLFGEGANLAKAIVYGPKGADDIKEYGAYTMSSDPSKYGTVAEGEYTVNYDKVGKSGALKSNWAIEGRGKIPARGGFNPAFPSRNPAYLDGVFIHRSNNNGYAGGGVSKGCPLICPSYNNSGNGWNEFNQQLQGVSQFKMILKRD